MTYSFKFFSPSQEDALLRWAIVASSFSLVGCLFVVTSFCLFKHLRNFSFELVMALAIANIGCCISYYLGSPFDGDPPCYIQAYMRVFFTCNVISFTCVIALFLRRVVVCHDFLFHEKRHIVYPVCIGIPFLLSVLPFTTGDYGNNGAWCSIAVDEGSWSSGAWWNLICLYGPLWGVVIYSIWCSISVGRILYGLKMVMSHGSKEDVEKTAADEDRASEEELQKKMKDLLTRLYLYPLILVVCWLPAGINYLVSLGSTPIFGLYVFQYTMSSLTGLLTSIVYGCSPSVISAWSSLCTGRFRRSGDAMDESLLAAT